MAIIGIEQDELKRGRFSRLMELLECSRAEAIGILALFRHETQQAKASEASLTRLIGYAPGNAKKSHDTVMALIRCGYIEPVAGEVHRVIGNAKAIERLERLRARASKAGSASVAKRKKPRTKAKAEPAQQGLANVTSLTPSPAPSRGPAARDAHQEACHQTWLAYARAYEARTCTPPLRTAKVSSILGNVVRALGQQRAPEVVRFYVERIDDPWIMQNCWPLEVFLRRIQAYATMHQRGAPITASRAQNYAQASSYAQRQKEILSAKR
jgi:hypothetical protein